MLIDAVAGPACAARIEGQSEGDAFANVLAAAPRPAAVLPPGPKRDDGYKIDPGKPLADYNYDEQDARVRQAQLKRLIGPET